MKKSICETDEFLVWSKKVEGEIDGESEMVTVMRWYAQDEVNQEDSEQNEVDGMKTGADCTSKVIHI